MQNDLENDFIGDNSKNKYDHVYEKYIFIYSNENENNPK